MKTLASRSALAVAGVLALAMTLAGLAAAGGPEGNSYLVSVKDSDNNTFIACLNFSDSHTMTTDGLPPGDVLTCMHDNLSRAPNNWQCTSQTGNSTGIEFHGRVTRNGKNIDGNAINDLPRTFVFKGQVNPTCLDAVGAQAAPAVGRGFSSK